MGAQQRSQMAASGSAPKASAPIGGTADAATGTTPPDQGAGDVDAEAQAAAEAAAAEVAAAETAKAQAAAEAADAAKVAAAAQAEAEAKAAAARALSEHVVAAGQCLSCTHDGRLVNEGEPVSADDLSDPSYFAVLVERGTIVLKGG
jgi:hypothetical protein